MRVWAAAQARLAVLLLFVLAAVPYASCRQPACPGCMLLRGSAGVSNASAAHIAYVANLSDPAAAAIKVPTVSLLEALHDVNVTHVLLLSNYSVTEFEAHANDQPALRLDRNVTLSAPEGLMPTLDFHFMRSVVHLCPTCHFHLHHIAIANERRGNGASIDFFVGEPGSVLTLQDSYRLRLACTSTNSTLELITKEQLRSPRFPLAGASNTTQRQVLLDRNVQYHGHNYTNMVWLVDYAYDVPAGFVEGKGMAGGYTLRTINSTRLCMSNINLTCLKFKGADACVNEAIDQLLSESTRQAVQAPQQQQAAAPGHGSPWLVAVIVPVTVVAGLIIASSLVMWVMCARHRQQRQQMQLDKSAKAVSAASEAGGAGSSKHMPGGGSASGSSKERALAEFEDGGADPFYADDLGEPRLDQGWEVVAANTSPSVGAVCSTKIHFGRLLGSGSFGRVYKGRWAGREVAIKSIEHDSETSKAVENEVQLMLAMDHPNIVKAYHYITYRHSQLDLQGCASNSPASVASSDPGAASASSAASPMSGASRGRQQRQQQKQLQQLERQLQHDLGPKHQWLLDMHLGFTCHSSSKGSHGSLHISGSSLDSPVPPTVVNSSPAVASTVLSPGQLSSQSTGVDSLSNLVLGEVVPGSPCDSSSAALHCQGLHLQAAPASGSETDGCVSAELPAASQQQQQQQDHSACELLPPEVGGLLDQHPPVQISLPPLDGHGHVEQQQQQGPPPQALRQPGVQQLQQHGQPLPLPPPLPTPQRQQEPAGPSDVEQQHVSILVPDQACGADGPPWSSRSGSLKSAHSHSSPPHSANGSVGSYPSTGQPLSPNQKVQLQRYLMKQQHLLQTSGMRVRPSGSLLPPMPIASGRPQQANGSSNGSDATAVSNSAGSGPSGRMPQEQHRSRTYIVQEYCDLGTFTNYASKMLTDPSDDEQMMQLLVLLQDAARGIAALHSKSVVHGDVNARNVLVSSSTAPYGAVAKLADLGLSRVIRKQATHKTTNTVGTLSHMPPELLRHGRMSAAVDIYSYGVMMWEVFTAQPAFRHLHYGQFFECIVMKNMRPNVPEDMPRDYSLLMLSCWATSPADRPSADRLLELLQMMLQERQEMCDEYTYSQRHTFASVVPYPAEAPAGRDGQQGGEVCVEEAWGGRGWTGLEVGGGADGSSSGGSSLHL